MYDACGVGQRSPSGSEYSEPWGFGAQWGYYTDPETGLVCMSHRYYDPPVGRFLTRDPLGYGGGINLYGFCGNNPVNFADPLGLVERWQYAAGGAVLGTAGGAVVGSAGGPVSSAIGGSILGTYFGMLGGQLYDAADAFGTAWGCWEGGDASGWQVTLAGSRAAFDVVTTALFLRGLVEPAGISGSKGGAASSPGTNPASYEFNKNGTFPHYRRNPTGGGEYYLMRPTAEGTGWSAAALYDEEGYVVHRIDFLSRSGRTDHSFPHFHVFEWVPGQRNPFGAPREVGLFDGLP